MINDQVRQRMTEIRAGLGRIVHEFSTNPLDKPSKTEGDIFWLLEQLEQALDMLDSTQSDLDTLLKLERREQQDTFFPTDAYIRKRVLE